MSDLELQREILRQTLEAIDRIERRFVGIQSAEDFLEGDEGIDKLDGIAMMLIWIGENIKALVVGCIRGSLISANLQDLP